MNSAKVIYTIKKSTREGKDYYQNALLINGRFGAELSVCSSDKDYSNIVGTEATVEVFWYKDHYCIRS